MSSYRCAASSTGAASSSARPPPSTTPNAPPPSPPSPPRRRARAAERLTYDELVLAPGSVSRTLPVPGLADHGIGFKTVEEAIGLRNHVIEQMDIASSTRDPAIRDAALTFVFVGGGYAGVEALGELEDMARYAARYYHNVQPRGHEVDPRRGLGPHPARGRRGAWAATRSPNCAAATSTYACDTRLDSCADRVAVLSDGARFPTRTVVWTAGVKPHPMLAATDLPLNDRGRLTLHRPS